MKLCKLRRKNKIKADKLLKYFFPLLALKFFWNLFKNSYFFELSKKGSFLGIVVFSFFIIMGKKIIFLEFLAINPIKQGMGLGSIMLNKIEKHARKKGGNFIFLISAPWRNKAHKFYKKHNYYKVLGFIFLKKI